MTAQPWSLYEAPKPVDRLAREIAELRPLPESALRIASLTTDDRFSAQDLATLITADPAVTARLLRLANSAYYGFPRRIGTVRDAVVLVGMRAVRAVVLVTCVMDGPPSHAGAPSVDARASWRFAVSVGVLAELLAGEAGVETDAAFTAGVLHNIGLVALDQYRRAEMGVVVRGVRSGRGSRHELERAVFGFTDAELGGALALRWAFPRELVAAIRDHARPLDELPDPRSLTACVLRARLIARAYGISDGVTPTAHDPAVVEAEREAELTATAAIADMLQRSGGMAGIMRRADAFVEATVG